MAQNIYENETYILDKTSTSSSRQGLERNYGYRQGSFFSGEHGDKDLNTSKGYYQFHNDQEKKLIVKPNREKYLNKLYGTSYHKEGNYRSMSRRHTSSSLSSHRRKEEAIYTNINKTGKNMTTTKRFQSGTYEQRRESPVIGTSEPHTARTVETATCCCCIDMCYCSNGRKREKSVTRETKHERVQNQRHSYDSEYWDSNDEEYGDKQRLIRNKENLQIKRYVGARLYPKTQRREYNPSKRHVAVQMNTQYVVHYDNPKQRDIKPKMRNSSTQTKTPILEYFPPYASKLEVSHVRRPPSPEPVGPMVVSHVHGRPSPEVMIQSTLIPYVPEDVSPEVKPRHSMYGVGQIPNDAFKETGPVAGYHVHQQPKRGDLDGTTPVLYERDNNTPRPTTPKGPKVVPFIGDPPDLNEKYVTAYFEYKKKKEPKYMNKPLVDDIVVHESEPDPPLPVPVNVPLPEPEITYYCDPTPEPEPEPYTPETPSLPSTPPPAPKKAPKVKSKSIMTRVGGGWMQVEHHRNHHIPLTVYEHPRALDGKFLYIKSKYTPDKERVPIAYKKYREMVVRNGKVG